MVPIMRLVRHPDYENGGPAEPEALAMLDAAENALARGDVAAAKDLLLASKDVPGIALMARLNLALILAKEGDALNAFRRLDTLPELHLTPSQGRLYDEALMRIARLAAEANGAAFESPLPPTKAPVVYLLSYPRSGSRHGRMLFHLMFDAPMYSVFNPDGRYFCRYAFDPHVPHLRIVKDHMFMPGYRHDRSIYLIRDGREAFLSFAYFLWRMGQTPLVGPGELAFLIRDGVSQIYGTWANHVAQAALMAGTGSDILISRYEDFLHDPAENQRMADFAVRGAGIEPVRPVTEVMDMIKAERKDYGAKDSRWGYEDQTIPPDSYLRPWQQNRGKDAWRYGFDAAARKAFHETGATDFLMEFGYETAPDWWKD